MGASNSVVTTGVDSLINLLKHTKSISVDSASRKLNISDTLLQSWIDLLVEEEIIGIEYKFITPYIYLIRKKDDATDIQAEFFEKAKSKGISPDRIAVLWKQYLLNHMEVIRKQFYEKALKRGLNPDRIDKLWSVYHKEIISSEYVEEASKQ